MIHYITELQMEESGRENVPGCEPDFPYTALINQVDDHVGRQVPWHWHEVFEFVLVRSGALEYATPSGVFVMQPGEGCFVNTGVLHRCCAYKGAPGVVCTVQQFERAAIAGAGWIERQYIAPLAACGALEILRLSPSRAEERAVLAEMERAFRAAADEREGFEMDICASLLRAWQGLWPLARPIVEREGSPARPENARVKQMLAYMRDHYAENIRLSEIAAAAGVCVRECLRCFRQELDMTPLACLTDMRVRKAAQLLRETSRTATDIALSCGFSSVSYFGKVFRKQMGVPPLEYRQK